MFLLVCVPLKHVTILANIVLAICLSETAYFPSVCKKYKLLSKPFMQSFELPQAQFLLRSPVLICHSYHVSFVYYIKLSQSVACEKCSHIHVHLKGDRLKFCLYTMIYLKLAGD